MKIIIYSLLSVMLWPHVITSNAGVQLRERQPKFNSKNTLCRFKRE